MSAREPAILGIDLGTTEVKAGLVTLDGRLLGLARAGYATDDRPATGWAEQDPGAWWSAVVAPSVRRRRRGRRRGRRDRRRRPRPDARRGRRPGRGDAAGDHLAGHARDRGGGRARRRDRGARLGARRAAGRAVGRAARAGGRGRDALVPRDVGVAGLPADRAAPTRRWSRASRPGRGRGDAAGVPAEGAAARRRPARSSAS